MTPLPWRREVVDDRVDLIFRADVDAARRLVEHQHLRLGEQPFAQHDLLLVAAGQVERPLMDAGGADAQRAAIAGRRPAPRARRR